MEFNCYTYSNGAESFNIDAELNFFIKSLGQLVSEESEDKIIQEELKRLLKLFESSQTTVEELRKIQENILKQVNEPKTLSVLAPDSDPLTSLQAGIDVVASTVERMMDKFKFGELAPAAGDVLQTGELWVKRVVG